VAEDPDSKRTQDGDIYTLPTFRHPFFTWKIRGIKIGFLPKNLPRAQVQNVPQWTRAELRKAEVVKPTDVKDASPRNRIIRAAKHLMSVLGYENATTEAICNEAHVTEAQLTKYFGTKEALLEAIFEDGWASLRMQLPVLQTTQSPKRRLKMLLHLLIRLFSDDTELRDLMLLEGRRIRRESRMVLLTSSYTELVAFLDSLIKAELKSAAPNKIQLVRSALIGLFEGLLRDKVLHDRFGFAAEFSVEEAEEYLSEAVDRLLMPAKP
jgi:AcrR family transcriptional regulator